MTIASSQSTPTMGNTTWGHALATKKAQTASVQMPALRVDPLARHIAIENALSAALWHMRHGTGTKAMQAATGRAVRAASMLKQAYAEIASGGRV